MNKLPGIEVVFFDAGGTLFEVNGSVGEIYSRIAAGHGCVCSPEIIEQNFRRAFPRQPTLAFPIGTRPEQLHQLEFAWWQKLAREVFADEDFPRFDEFFTEVYEYFRRGEAWRLFDDVLPALNALKQAGFRLAIISNFDSRIDDLLADLGLHEYFEAVHISSRLGAAKPDPGIFFAALNHHGVAPERALHIGDSWREDVEGARAAGIRAFLLDRSGTSDQDFRLTRLDKLISN